MIEDVVRAEILRELESSRSGIVAAVIEQAFEEKVDRGYSREKKWEKMVKDAIRAEALEVWKEFIDKHRAKIREAILNHLQKNKAKALREIAASMVDGISGYTASVRFDFKERRDG